MTGTIDFFFEFASPYSYIAAQRLTAVAASIGRRVIWRPIQLSTVWAGQDVLDAYAAVRKVKR